ncbi:MAG TPA: glycoside hydrolase family 3 N-terminal domain-containing protein [Thermoleophilaceae bacterium]|nr:glycoside hydrolase family 3 N-terminal domain-containing protein [Thermoleophilaceae bacterium]
MTAPSRFVGALVALVALASLAVGTVVGARESDKRAAGGLPARAGGAAGQTSFLDRIVPARNVRERTPRGPAAPRSVRDLARRLPLERKVGQLFLLGFEGNDTSAAIFPRLRRFDLGGIVVARENYVDPGQLATLGGEARKVATAAGHVPPWVLTAQDGAEFNSLPGLPPTEAPADLQNAGAATAQATETAATLRGLNVTGVLDPVVDVGSASGSPLGARIYSDEPDEVSGYADAVVRAYRAKRLFSAAKHFPGLGAADQLTEVGPASVGLGLDALRKRDLLPFRAAIEAGAPAVMVSSGLYPMNNFTRPASLTRSIVTGLLRDELGFAGVAITDDLADPAISTSYSVPDAAVMALQAGADMLFVSGSAGDQQAAYTAVLRAVQRGRLSRARLDEAVLRDLHAKLDYGLIR